MKSHAQPGLFDDLPAPARATELPPADEPWRPVHTEYGGWISTPPRAGHTADTIRLVAHEILAEARAAPTLPWDARHLRSYTAMMPYYAEWLKNGEGDRLMADFKAEMDRLDAPADQVAPNWRSIWGLAE